MCNKAYLKLKGDFDLKKIMMDKESSLETRNIKLNQNTNIKIKKKTKKNNIKHYRHNHHNEMID